MLLYINILLFNSFNTILCLKDLKTSIIGIFLQKSKVM